MLKPSETAPGKKYGRLTIVEETSRRNKHRYFDCVCDCGVCKPVRLDLLRDGSTVSCGCYNRQVSAEVNTKHGLSKSRIYSIHIGMKGRCLNINNDFYKNYGGRGIAICKEWFDVEVFYKWAINNGYQKNLTIERVNVNGNYEPSNCTWITMDAQKRNTTVTKRLTFNGKTMTMRQWSKEIGISVGTLCNRFSKGLSVEQALTHKKYAKL